VRLLRQPHRSARSSIGLRPRKSGSHQTSRWRWQSTANSSRKRKCPESLKIRFRCGWVLDDTGNGVHPSAETEKWGQGIAVERVVQVVHRRDPRACVATATSLAARRAGGALYGALIVKCFGLAGIPCLSLAECRRRAPTLCRATQTGSADGSRPTAAKRARVSASLCVGHVRQFGGESPLCNLMEVKH
jgi:hypothetical protein